MYTHLVFALYLFVSSFILVHAQVCNSTYCTPEFFGQPPSKKSNATHVYYVGNLYNNQADSNSLVKMAIMDINNDMSILPDVRLELYSLSFKTAQHSIIAALKMYTYGVQSIIENAEDDYLVHDISMAFSMPLYTLRAMDDAFREKRIYTMLTRVFPSSADCTEAMVALVASLNYTGALLITTKDTHVTASAETFTQQAAERNIRNVFTVSIPPYPLEADYLRAVNESKNIIAEYSLRPIIIMTTPATGPGMVNYLYKGGVYGPDHFYMFSADVTRVVLSPTATIAKPIMDGSFIMFPRDGLGKSMPTALANWKARNITLLPGNPVSPQSQWLAYDAAWVIAHAVNGAMKNKSYSQVTHADVLSATYNVSFESVSGRMEFNSLRDYKAVNGMTFFQIYNHSAVKYGIVSTYALGKFNITTPYVFYNLSSTPPNPGYCKYCFHGTCNAQSICVCDVGYQGEFCSDTKKGPSNTLQIVLPVVGVVVIAASIAIYYYRWRREQLIKDLAQRQRSDINRSEIKLLDRIGRGASGAVYKALFRGTEVAAKSLLTSSTSADILEAFKMETAIMCALRHPNIVLFMGSCYDNVQKEMLLVMEFCSRGSLHDLLNDPKVNLSYELLLHLACQSSQGMNFLHESSPPIIHRDLKSHNILLDDKFNAKISDFGLTKFKDKKDSNSGNELGTVFWSAPEVLNGKSHTEKSDVYSFGIVLWEMWHRQDPYPMMDLVTVAIEVMNKGIRPVMDPNTPQEIQDLIRDCWAQEPTKRPDFQGITQRLRNLSMQNPMHTFATGHQSRIEAPTGQVYLVHSEIPSLFHLFDNIPKPTKKAFMLHNHLVRTNLELYGGYEVRMKSNGGFFVVFNNCASAVNWCIATQVALTHLSWPEEVLMRTEACEVAEGGTVIYRGLRVRMSVFMGTPHSDIDATSGRMTYFGPIAQKAKSMLKASTIGSIVIDNRVMEEINTKKMPLIENVVSKLAGDIFEDGESMFLILPSTLQERFNYNNKTIQVVTMEEAMDKTILTFTPSSSALQTNSSSLSTASSPTWLIPFKQLTVFESVGKGQVGDYYRGAWNQRQVAVKVLVNQKLREEDFISLLSDVSVLSRIKHPNLLPVHGVCTKRGNIAIIVDYVENGSLKDLIAREAKTLTVKQCINIAYDIAVGMNFLTTQPNHELHIHDNFKSNNILVSKDLEVRITDFGQTNIKDLARTMTSISSVAWTAPEILNGDPITTKSAVYSFGIVLWELFSKKVPYEGEHPLKVVSKILSGFRPAMPDCPVPVQRLMQSCWDESPEARPTWHVIMTELSHMQ